MKYFYSFILLVIFSSAISFSRANEPAWRPIQIDKEASYLVDEQSVLRDGYSTNATLAVRPSKKQAIKDLVFGSASYAVQAQCINKFHGTKFKRWLCSYFIYRYLDTWWNHQIS
jgi:hypothetical protein